MAAKMQIQLLMFALFTVSLSYATFDQFFTDVTSCLQVCTNTYLTQEENISACRRGCRLFYVCKFSRNHQNLNDTCIECNNACHEAYTNNTAQNAACSHGCTSALPVAAKREQENENSEPSIHLLYPFLYVHGLYSNMIDKVYKHMSVSWSFYMQGDNGNLVVMRSRPKVYVEYRTYNGDEYRTSNYVETNIESGNVATPQLRNSQLHPGSSSQGSDDELNLSLHDLDGQSADWLACISQRIGMPRMLLTALVLLCAVVMIWLCLTAAVTPPEHRVSSPPQKLSIYGDLDYLIDFEQKSVKKFLPQDTFVAAPLPVKIKVDRI